MNVEIKEDYLQLCAAVAEQVIASVTAKPDALICIAGGDTPLGVFEALVNASNAGRVDFSHASFIGLDEWLGLGRSDKGSCREMIWHHFFDKLTLRDEQICFFDGLTHDPQAECLRVDAFIAAHQQIDIIVLGIGMNGHIGFNEPGVSPDKSCHVVDLDAITQAVSVKYFGKPLNIKQGISLGIKTIRAAKRIILMASGEKKSTIVAKTLQAEIGTEIPATLVKDHPSVTLMVDRAASSQL